MNNHDAVRSAVSALLYEYEVEPRVANAVLDAIDVALGSAPSTTLDVERLARALIDAGIVWDSMDGAVADAERVAAAYLAGREQP